MQKIAGINEQMMSEALIEMTAQDELSVLMKKGEVKERKEGSMQYVPIVDGGWGWVVVVGSFFIHVFADGIVYSFGILLEIVMKEFSASNAKASVIISLLTGLTLGMGPVASAITNKFGCRVTTILGSLIATTGCATSYYATSVEYLMLSVGCVMGIGFGLMYCPAIIIVTTHFEKKRSMATGIAVCGAGVGTVVFAPISEALIKISWRTVFAVYAVIVLMCSLCGATFRSLTFVAVEDETKRRKYSKKMKKMDSLKWCISTSFSSYFLLVLLQLIIDEENGPLSTTLLASHNQQNINDIEGKNGKLGPSKSLISDISHGRSRGISESTGFITVKDVFYTSSMNELPQTECHRSLTSLNIKDDKLNLKEEEKISKARGILRTMEKMTDISLLANPVFLFYAISNLLTSIAFNSPLVFLPSHATSLGLTPTQSASVISAFGIMNTVGRILVGLISDRKLPCKYGKDRALNRLWIYVSSLSLCGLLTAGVLFCDGYITLAMYSGLFGLTLSSYVCLTSVLLVDLIGIEKLTNAFGLILLFQGIGTVIGPPISGQLADLTGSYDMSFVFCGVALLISGLMLVFVPQIQRNQTVAVA
ncbi:major facilitator superfamily transporter [Wuchereria bancrofti]|uniref:Major facilitator superfamily transporter n=1 Tax=Wuchereria bancrofti TaxID=6293 RepID=J9BKQ3_WUCBA|nr:major facilitator superfamily transporter [Wuchereria bancrofti]